MGRGDQPFCTLVQFPQHRQPGAMIGGTLPSAPQAIANFPSLPDS